MKKFRIGVIGAGLISYGHVSTASTHPKVEVAAIADIRLDAAEKLANMFNVKKVTNNPEDIVSDKSIDIVIIALPTHLHYKWIMESAKAGKHILTEKPLTRYVRDAKKLVDYCTQQKVILSVGYQRRFYPDRIKIKEIIQSGKIGRPVTWTISQFYPRPTWLTHPRSNRYVWIWNKEGGGMLMDMGVHNFDFAYWVLGKPVYMYAQSRRISDCEAPTQASAIIHFEKGDNFVFNEAYTEGDFGSGCTPVTIVGPKGTIVFNQDSWSFTWNYASGKKKDFKFDVKKQKPCIEQEFWSWTFYKQMDAFIKSIEKGKIIDDSLTPGEQAVFSLWVSEKIIESGPKGKIYRMEEK